MEATEQLIKVTSIVYAVVQLFIYFHIYGFLEYLKSRNRVNEQCLHNSMLLVTLYYEIPSIMYAVTLVIPLN